jgi:hypothetical protein
MQRHGASPSNQSHSLASCRTQSHLGFKLNEESDGSNFEIKRTGEQRTIPSNVESASCRDEGGEDDRAVGIHPLDLQLWRSRAGLHPHRRRRRTGASDSLRAATQAQQAKQPLWRQLSKFTESVQLEREGHARRSHRN